MRRVSLWLDLASPDLMIVQIDHPDVPSGPDRIDVGNEPVRTPELGEAFAGPGLVIGFPKVLPKDLTYEIPDGDGGQIELHLRRQ